MRDDTHLNDGQRTINFLIAPTLLVSSDMSPKRAGYCQPYFLPSGILQFCRISSVKTVIIIHPQSCQEGTEIFSVRKPRFGFLRKDQNLVIGAVAM